MNGKSGAGPGTHNLYKRFQIIIVIVNLIVFFFKLYLVKCFDKFIYFLIYYTLLLNQINFKIFLNFTKYIIFLKLLLNQDRLYRAGNWAGRAGLGRANSGLG